MKFFCDKGWGKEVGSTNELFVEFETYITVGQGALGSQDALTSTQGGEKKRERELEFNLH